MVLEVATPNQTNEVPTMKTKNKLTIATIAVALASWAESPSRTRQVQSATAEWIGFLRVQGIENWQVVSVSQTPELLKVEVANPTMIDAYRAGIPGNGKPFRTAPKLRRSSGDRKRWRSHHFSKRAATLQDVFPDRKG